MDDMTGFLECEDLVWCLKFFVQQGPKCGVHLNKRKTKILTTPSSSSLNVLTAAQRVHLAEASALLDPTVLGQSVPSIIQSSASHLRDWIKMLGQPIGCTTFCQAFIDKVLKKFEQQLSRLQNDSKRECLAHNSLHVM